MDLNREQLPAERSFYAKIAVVGPTGTGKSYLSKTCDVETTGYINMERKPLPYRQTQPFKYMSQPKSWTDFKKAIEDFGKLEGLSASGKTDFSKIKRIIIDSQTMAFNTLNKEMNANFTDTWVAYRNYNKQVYEYLEMLKGIEKDVIVLAHDEWLKLEGEGKKRMMAVHGKEFEGKIEQHFTTVMYTGSRMKDGKPNYFIRTFEPETSTKVPEGMFPDKDGNNLLEIPNNGKYIFDAAEEYYSIPSQTN